MTRRTRMYVANLDNPTLVWGNLLDLYEISGYTVYDAVGVWEFETEPVKVVEILGGTRAQLGKLANLLTLYARAQGEEAIAVTIEDGDGTLDGYVLRADEDSFVGWERV